jgi:hypothetical protein
VKVVVLIVAGFMALLNVAVMTAVFGQTSVEPSGGVTEVTVGAVKGEPGLPTPAFLSGSPHPATRAANRNAGNKILLIFKLRISFSSSPSYTAFQTSGSDPCIFHGLSFIVCSVLNTSDGKL